MGKRRVPVSAAAIIEPWEPTCLVCRSTDVTTGAFLERPMVECAFCAACVARLMREAARGRTAKVDWRLLPRCSRCGAQVPGMARIPWDNFDETVDEFDTVYLCQQCCVTIHRQGLLIQEELGGAANTLIAGFEWGQHENVPGATPSQCPIDASSAAATTAVAVQLLQGLRGSPEREE